MGRAFARTIVLTYCPLLSTQPSVKISIRTFGSLALLTYRRRAEVSVYSLLTTTSATGLVPTEIPTTTLRLALPPSPSNGASVVRECRGWPPQSVDNIRLQRAGRRCLGYRSRRQYYQ